MAFLTTAHVGDVHLEEDHYFGAREGNLQFGVGGLKLSPFGLMCTLPLSRLLNVA